MVKMTKLKRMTRNLGTTREHGMGHVPPSFVLIGNKCILSCTIILNKSNEELRMKQWCLYLHSSFPFFQDIAIKVDIIWS